MCGCMLMHAVTDHEEHRHSTQTQSLPSSGPSTMPAASGQKCSHCGFPLGQGFTFCPNCGMSLRTLKCDACGQEVDPSWSACAYCGSPLGEAKKQSTGL